MILYLYALNNNVNCNYSYLIFFCFQGRQVEAKRLRENRDKLGDKDVQEIDNHWRKLLEEKEAESKTKENRLLEKLTTLEKQVMVVKISFLQALVSSFQVV